MMRIIGTFIYVTVMGFMAFLLVNILMYQEPISVPSKSLVKVSGQSTQLSGQLTIIWGDPLPHSKQPVETRYFLITDSGQTVEIKRSPELSLSELFLSYDNQYVTVIAKQLTLITHSTPQIEVEQIWVSDSSASIATTPQTMNVSGSTPWVSIMCKFPDVAAEPQDLAYFQDMYANSYPGLDHHWREQSFDLIDLVGSTAVGWYTLPLTRSAYIPNGVADLNLIANHCMDLADPEIHFPDFVGVNLMFNDLLDCCAWGGGIMTTRDGLTQRWNVTWNPPWSYANMSILQHEMGHGFGLPHSIGGGSEYGNRWDVMSGAYGIVSDPMYGNLGKHTISFYKDRLGWIDTAEKFTAPLTSSTTISLEQLALPQTNSYKMAQIPIGGSDTHFYTVEVRRQVGYDMGLPGNAVIIHEIPDGDHRAHVIDIDGDGDTSDEGARWEVGESFIDSVNGITVTIDSALPTGSAITIQVNDKGFAKTSPSDTDTNLSTSPTLSWESYDETNQYEYCYDTSNDNSCSNWVSTALNTSVTLNGLNANTTYYWQVRAINNVGTTYGNNSSTAYWSFTTGNEVAPIVAISQVDDNDAQLSWLANPSSCSYQVHSSVAPYFTADSSNTLSAKLADNVTGYLLANAIGTTTFYQVVALGCSGIDAPSNEVGVFTFGIVPGTP